MAKLTYTARNQSLHSSMAKPNKREQQETQVQNYAGTQKNAVGLPKQRRVPLRHLRPSIIYWVPCERIVPRTHSLLVSINMKTMMSPRSQEYNQQSDSFVLYKKLT